MNRRRFLTIGRLARTAGQIAGAVEEARSAACGLLADDPPRQELALIHVSRSAMATRFEIILPWGLHDSTMAADDALDLIERLEAQLTVYRDDSEVAQLNRNAPCAAVQVEERLYDLLGYCALLSRETCGAFDITTGALIRTWGFFRRQGRVPSPSERKAALTRVGSGHLVFDDERQSIRFDCEGLEINLGSIGKGYALDRAAELLRDRWHVTAGLLHGGHSSVIALGSDPRDRRGWSVAISHPWIPDRKLAEVRLRDAALATSAATFQHLEHNGRKLPHVLDPRTGWPAQSMSSATVIASSAARADALSTAFFVMGPAAALAYCRAHPDVGAILLPAGDDCQPLILNLPADSLAPGTGAG
jgi:thiamine biosynthesis lipoprotein